MVGFYRRQVLPRITEKLLDKRRIQQLRAEATRSLRGEVVEIGFGSGLNLPVLPKDVRVVHAIDPDEIGQQLAAKRIEAANASVVFAGLDGEHLPLESSSMDGALSTFTMCSIGDLSSALKEVRRVLAPGGQLVFLEHGLAPTPRLAKWQRRLNPFYSPIAGGCRLDLDVERALAEAGFEVVELEHSTLGARPGLSNNIVRGIAIPTL